MTGKLRQSLLDLPKALTLSTWTAGLLAVIVGFTGSLVLTFQVADVAGLTPAQLSSWVFSITVGSGILCISLSLFYKQPVLTAWSTPGLAVLASSLGDYTLSDAVGAYLVIGLAIMILGFSGLFERVMRLLPQSVALAVLGGVLFKFGLGLFTSLSVAPVMVLVMMVVFLFFKRLNWQTPMALALVAGFMVAFFSGQVHLNDCKARAGPPYLHHADFSLAGHDQFRCATFYTGISFTKCTWLCSHESLRLYPTR